MLDQFHGLPTHALIVHFTVVALPLAALGAILIALLPRARRRYGLLVGAVTLAAVAAVPVTVESGQELFARRSAAFGPDDVTEAGLMEQHRELAEALPKWAVLLLVGVLLLVVPPVLVRRSRARRREPVPVGAGPDGAAPGRLGPLGRLGLVEDPRGPSWQLPVALVAVVATLVGAVMTLVMVARVGEAGARAAWSDTAAPAAIGAPPG